jgi:anti-sigma factor RsiW
MKPCTKNKKLIAWLALNELDAAPAQELRAHLKTCPACGQYWREISAVCQAHSVAGGRLREVPASESFHHNLVRRIKQAGASPRSSLAGDLLMRWLVGWRVVLPAGVCILVLLGIYHGSGRRPDPPRHIPAAPVSGSGASGSGYLEPSLSWYGGAADVSPEALDEILAKQALRGSGLPPAVATFADTEKALEN